MVGLLLVILHKIVDKSQPLFIAQNGAHSFDMKKVTFCLTADLEQLGMVSFFL